jgi:vancomycin resistance protein YoaR
VNKKLLMIGLLLAAFWPSLANAADEPLTSLRLKTNFNIWRVNLEKADFLNTYPKLSWNGFDVKLADTLDDGLKTKTQSYMVADEATGVDYAAVKRYLQKVASPEVDRAPEDVTISLDEKGKVKFDGFAFNGQSVDFEKAFYLIRQAIQDQVEEIRLPLAITPAKVTVLSDELKQQGIAELISMGETNFANSPRNRRVNIRVGLNSFSGKVVPKGTETGAGDILGRVDQTTGYLPELVIKGDKTVPEYGGGLCQVSTTVYRAVLMGGFPITKRTNHSYAVSYYDPQGLDATIYPPDPDMKFINDTPNSILLQTLIIGDKAYANVYGTPVDRHVDLIGPWYYDYKSPPPARTAYSTKIPAGEKVKLGEAHMGFKADWYRRITYGDPDQMEKLERIHSDYEPRPLFTVFGIDPASPPPEATPENTDKVKLSD